MNQLSETSMPVSEAPAAAPIPDVRRREVLGVPMAMTDYDGAIGVMDAMIDSETTGWVCAASVHSLVTAKDDEGMHEALTNATMTVPDGMPIVWAANGLGEDLDGRVYGPELMDRFCAQSAARGHRVWLYGGRDEGTLAQLTLNLRRRHPGLQIVGGWSPPFRDLSTDEEEMLAQRINADKPDVVWVGVGVPKQEKWMVRMRGLLDAPVLCGVGAAFDFHAGRVPQAPEWMQSRGLEWLFRMAQEPRRLLPRYLRTNPMFVAGVARQWVRERTLRRR